MKSKDLSLRRSIKLINIHTDRFWKKNTKNTKKPHVWNETDDITTDFMDRRGKYKNFMSINLKMLIKCMNSSKDTIY